MQCRQCSVQFTTVNNSHTAVTRYRPVKPTVACLDETAAGLTCPHAVTIKDREMTRLVYTKKDRASCGAIRLRIILGKAVHIVVAPHSQTSRTGAVSVSAREHMYHAVAVFVRPEVFKAW